MFKNLYNHIDFFFRENIRFSRKYNGRDDDIERLRLENLAIEELLRNYINVEGKNIKILDIGSKNWFYVKGLYNFFKYNNSEREISLEGIEIDAFRVYSNFHTRYDYAKYYSKDLPNCRYITGDLLQHQGKYDYITWFYPFVTEYPLLEWGLPLSKFKPLQMLQHACSLLKPGGIMLIANQDEKEYEIQENLFKTLNIPYDKKGEFKNSYIQKERKCLITMSQNIY